MNNNNHHANTAKFHALYEKLNTAQRQAVDTIEGPVLVVAGPGTGKTQVLSARIANILQKTDVAPYNILALTFTESAAKNMQERVVSMIGKEGYYVEITTFHSFCASVITSYPEYFPISRESKAISSVELFETVKSIITEQPLETLKPLNAPFFYLKDIVRAISQLKREGITPERFSQLVTELYTDDLRPDKKAAAASFDKQKAKNTELAQVFAAYQKKLREQNRYDFDDMIVLVIEAFKKEETLLLEYQEKYQYFLVDEYQDTNTAQNEVVQLLASFWGKGANIFVVGDPHQSIYRFQGASTENVIGFTEQYPNSAVITLEVSYRCPQELNVVAHALIENNMLTSSDATKLLTETAAQSSTAGATLQKALTTLLSSSKRRADAVEIWSAPSQTIELIQVAEKIKSLVTNGVKAEEIAVLYRTNREAHEISEVLEKWEVPYEIDGGSNVFDFEPIRQLLQLLQVIELFKTNQEDERFFEVLCYEWLKLENLSVYRLTHLAGKERKSLQEIIKLGHEAIQVLKPDCLTEEEYGKIAGLIEKLNRWASLDGQLTFPEWLEIVMQESGFLEWITEQPTVVEHLLYVNTLKQQIQEFAQERPNFKLVHFLAAVETMQGFGIPLIVQDLNIQTGAVHLSTVHKAKGQEWSYVFVVHCTDGVWGNTRERNMLPQPAELLSHTDITKKERNEDDRRLLYVALTRAKEQVIVSYPETVITNSAVKTVNPSMFIHEIQEKIATLESKKNLELIEKQEEYLRRLVAPPLPTDHTEHAKIFFTQVVSRYKLSISALNNYLRDPATFILRNLLVIPSGNTPYLAFGTAIHAALEVLFKQVIAGEKIDSEKIFKRYEEKLSTEILTREDYDRRLIHGKKVLSDYIAQVDPALISPWQLEARFGDGVRKTVLDDIPLVGRIDRLDWIDQAKKTVRVIDYKTGSSKTRNALEGKTQSAGLSEREQQLPESIRSPFKRQLLFYKLLTELDRSFEPTVTQGVFEFVVPDAQTGKTVSHAFELPDEEVAELKTLIQEVVAELRSLQFLEHLPAAISTVGLQSK